jgi:hypothetical protein
LDNGPLRGTVTATQRSSTEHVYVGRRSDSDGFEFAGLIDDVRIYSRSLTKAEIRADMRGTVLHGSAGTPATGNGIGSHNARRPNGSRAPCSGTSDRHDAKTPAVAAVLGVLVAVACIGLWPSAGLLHCLAISFAAGLPLLLTASPNLSSLARWILLLVCLAGSASVSVSLSHRNAPPADD